MSGISKPSVVGLKAEVGYTVNGVLGNQASGGTIANPALFNGVASNGWDDANVMYWNNTSHYIDITINKNCNIWRSGTDGWKASNAPLKIEQWSGSAWVDVTSTYPQTLTQVTHLQWEKTITKLPQGRYKFSGTGGARLDSEWYLEQGVFTGYLLQNETNDLFTVNGGLVNLGTQTPTEALYLTNGFSDIALLNGTTFNQTKTMVDEGVVGTGRVFSLEIDTSMIKSVNVT